ncbi:isocitrate lyase/phosphoenolpyruvate mutase family protein [soil metagenome]
MSADLSTARTHAARLVTLHQQGLLVLPNAWDAASARLVAEAGFPVVATASNAISAVLGHPDGEGVPVDEMFAATATIARVVDVPVTMDAEGGYGLAAAELVDRLLSAGAVGCNLEDTDRAGGLEDAGAQADWLAEVRAAATAAGVPIVINARIDAFLPTSGIAPDAAVAETVRRAAHDTDAGVDCLYPIGMASREQVAAVVEQVRLPVNANPSPALGLADLAALGVRRASYGPQLYRAALEGVRERLATIAASLP